MTTVIAVKSFIVQAPEPNIIKLFTAVIKKYFIKLECFPWSAFPTLLVRSRAYPRKGLLSDAPLAEALALFGNIELGWKGLQGTNTLAYYKHS